MPRVRGALIDARHSIHGESEGMQAALHFGQTDEWGLTLVCCYIVRGKVEDEVR